MSWILSLAIGICMVLAVGTPMIALLVWVGRRRQGPVHGPHDRDLEARVAEVERRLTDTQDIVIALNEKLESLEVGATVPTR